MTAETDSEGHLVYTRNVEVRAHRLRPEGYDVYRAFVAAVALADDAQVILRRR